MHCSITIQYLICEHTQSWNFSDEVVKAKWCIVMSEVVKLKCSRERRATRMPAIEYLKPASTWDESKHSNTNDCTNSEASEFSCIDAITSISSGITTAARKGFATPQWSDEDCKVSELSTDNLDWLEHPAENGAWKLRVSRAPPVVEWIER